MGNYFENMNMNPETSGSGSESLSILMRRKADYDADPDSDLDSDANYDSLGGITRFTDNERDFYHLHPTETKPIIPYISLLC
jgi:hypothetical protein